MGVNDVVKLVERMIQEGLQERMLWYSTKYDWNILMPLQKDENMG